jgi:hypothetical protein
VLGGLIERIITAPLKDSSLQKRVARVLRSIYTLTEEDFPDNLKEDWRKLKAVDEHPINPQNMWLIKFRDETEARAMSLTRKEARQVLRAYVNIVIGITERIGATRGSM